MHVSRRAIGTLSLIGQCAMNALLLPSATPGGRRKPKRGGSGNNISGCGILDNARRTSLESYVRAGFVTNAAVWSPTMSDLEKFVAELRKHRRKPCGCDFCRRIEAAADMLETIYQPAARADGAAHPFAVWTHNTLNELAAKALRNSTQDESPKELVLPT